MGRFDRWAEVEMSTYFWRQALYTRSYDDIQDQWLESFNPYQEEKNDDQPA